MLQRRTGQDLGEIDRLTGEIATVARAILRVVTGVECTAWPALGKRPSGRLAHLVGRLAGAATGTRRLLEQAALRLAAIGTIPDRLVSLVGPDARPIRKGKSRHPTRFGCPALLARGERDFVVDACRQRARPRDTATDARSPFSQAALGEGRSRAN
jgi:IS5 family transposase